MRNSKGKLKPPELNVNKIQFSITARTTTLLNPSLLKKIKTTEKYNMFYLHNFEQIRLFSVLSI